MPQTTHAPRRVCVIIGTRPEAVKLCPLVLALRQAPGLEPVVCLTGQHRDMVAPFLALFGVAPDADLQAMRAGQGLSQLTARLLVALDEWLGAAPPDLVVVQGDTTSALCGALAAYYRQIPVAHVEAGLRTFQKYAPFPEEINRSVLSRIADLHFAPTERARANLLREGVPPDSIHVTGNTVVDAVLLAAAKVRASPPAIPGLPPELTRQGPGPRLVLITAHRRENLGAGLESICVAVKQLAARFPNVHFVYPVHPNAQVREPVFRVLGNRPNVHLIEPVEYLGFVALMDRATLILSDSGGIQEEAPSLGKPVLVLRDCTERPEAVEAGVAKLVGTDTDTIVRSVAELLQNATAHARMTGIPNPFGDGHASARIVATLQSFHGCREVRPSRER